MYCRKRNCPIYQFCDKSKEQSRLCKEQERVLSEESSDYMNTNELSDLNGGDDSYPM